MIKKIILSIIFVITFSTVVVHSEIYWGGELPNINDTEVNAAVSFDGVIYTYFYTISSGPTNSGSIWSFAIDIKKPREGIELSDDGISNGPRYMINTSDQVLSEPNTQKMIPVGLWSPVNWISSLDVFGQARWGGSLLQPGESLNGFQIMSRGLPGLRDFIIEPRIEPPFIEPDMSPEEGRAMIEEVEDSVAFKGKTIGPTTPSRIFIPLNFLNIIQSYINNSITLGWLIDPALIIALQADIDTTRSFIEANDPSSAKTALSHFMTLLDEASSSQRTAEAYGLLFFNAKYLFDKLPDTYIPPPPRVLEVTPEDANLSIGTIHTLTVIYKRGDNPIDWLGCPLRLEVIEGPNAGLVLEEFPSGLEPAVLSYTGTLEGTDKINVYLREIPDLCEGLDALPVQVTWSGGPDLVIELFVPPVIKGEAGKTVFITEITGNRGNTDAGNSITRYFISEDEIIDPDEDIPFGERPVPTLNPGQSSEVNRLEFQLPNDLSEGFYHLGACADANEEVEELNEENNCEVNQIIISLEQSSNQPPDCTQAFPSDDLLWPPNHKLVTISVIGVIDPDGDEVTLTVTGITQDEPVNGLGDGDTSPDGFGIGTSQAEIRRERSGRGNGRVYAISFNADDGKEGTCTGQVAVGVPHDQGKKGRIPVDDGQYYDSTQP